jgi:hypothetical protein
MNRLTKKITALVFLGFLSVAIVVSCGKAKEGDHPAGEHPTDSAEHPSDSTEHPSDSTEHPSEHPADSTQN